MGPGQDHRRRPRAAAGARLQPLSGPARTRVVEVAPARFDDWLARFEAANPGPEPAQRVVAVDRFDHDPVALVLVRRGGYAVGLAHAGGLAAHKVGTRYVQSRTAAGGWSQQRFARRRANQADGLVGAVAEHAVRLLPPGAAVAVLLGGDRALARQVLDDPRLRHLAGLPRRELYGIPDPRLAVLEEAGRRARAVRVTIADR